MTVGFPHREKLWCVTIRWSRARSYEDVRMERIRDDGTAHFYAILAKTSRSSRLAYVGKTYRSEVWHRFKARDHKSRLKYLKKKFPGGKFSVSHGSIRMGKWRRLNGRSPSAKRIDHIETLLVMGGRAACNRRKYRSHGIIDHYKIANEGFCRFLPKCIVLTVTISKEPR